MQQRMEETVENQQKYMTATNKIRKEKARLSGRFKEMELLYTELKREFEEYKEQYNEDTIGDGSGGGGGNGSGHKGQNSFQLGNGGGGGMVQFTPNGGFKMPSGPIDPEALYAGYFEPSTELEMARMSYKKMKMASDQQAQQIRKLLREKTELSEQIGRLEVDIQSQRELVERRDEQMVQLQTSFDREISQKLRPFVKLVENVGRDVLHNAPTSYIFNYRKQVSDCWLPFGDVSCLVAICKHVSVEILVKTL